MLNVLFVPRQPNDPGCKKIGMYYSEEMDRIDLCDIENALMNGHQVTINHAAKNVIDALNNAFFPKSFPDDFDTTA
jgi:hypothetical protein